MSSPVSLTPGASLSSTWASEGTAGYWRYPPGSQLFPGWSLQSTEQREQPLFVEFWRICFGGYNTLCSQNTEAEADRWIYSQRCWVALNHSGSSPAVIAEKHRGRQPETELRRVTYFIRYSTDENSSVFAWVDEDFNKCSTTVASLHSVDLKPLQTLFFFFFRLPITGSQ